jgi:hypothetical protein
LQKASRNPRLNLIGQGYFSFEKCQPVGEKRERSTGGKSNFGSSNEPRSDSRTLDQHRANMSKLYALPDAELANAWRNGWLTALTNLSHDGLARPHSHEEDSQ